MSGYVFFQSTKTIVTVKAIVFDRQDSKADDILICTLYTRLLKKLNNCRLSFKCFLKIAS